jgi:hypothetical protein
VKRNFGNLVTRVLRGGTRLTDAEHFLLSAMVERLDPEVRGVVESHFEQYNLAQREIDGRALNFYRVAPGRRVPQKVSDPLDMTVEEAPLIKIAVSAPSERKPLHAVLTAVNGQVFCVTFDRAPPKPHFEPNVSVVSYTQTWRSVIRAHTRVAQQIVAADREP